MGAGVLGLLLLSWCRGPEVLYPAPPVAQPDDSAPAESRASTIAVPIVIPLGALVELLEAAVPSTHGSLEDFQPVPNRDNVSVAYELERERFRATFSGGTVRLSTTIHYAMRAKYRLPALPDPVGTCGTGDGARPRLSVAIETPVSVDEDWKLRTRARIAGVHATSSTEADACEVTFLSLDVTDQVVDGTRDFLADHLRDIDSLAARVDTRPRFVDWWHTLQQPIELNDSLWLLMGPEAVRRGSVHGTGDSVTVELALRARPSIVFGHRPSPAPVALPPLQTGQVVPELDLLVDARAGYGSATRFLNRRLAGQEIDLPGRRTVQVDSLRLYGIGSSRLAMEVHVSGDLAGRLYLTGRPTIEPDTEIMTVPDLDLDVATRDLVFRAASLLSGNALRDYFRERARWPADPAVRWLTGWLRRGLNRDISEDLRVAGTVKDLRIVGAHALRETMIVRVAASGSARLLVRH